MMHCVSSSSKACVDVSAYLKTCYSNMLRVNSLAADLFYIASSFYFLTSDIFPLSLPVK